MQTATEANIDPADQLNALGFNGANAALNVGGEKGGQ